jgi:hypothetical protein
MAMMATAIPGMIGGIASMFGQRSAKRQMQQQRKMDLAQAGQAQAQAAAEHANIAQQASRLEQAKHSMTPQQIAAEQAAAAAPMTAAANAAAAEQARAATRTHQGGALAKSQGELMRAKMAGTAGASEKIAGADVAGAQALQTQGRELMAGLGKQDVESQLKQQEMGQQAAQQQEEAAKGIGQTAASLLPTGSGKTPGGTQFPTFGGDEGMNVMDDGGVANPVIKGIRDYWNQVEGVFKPDPSISPSITEKMRQTQPDPSETTGLFGSLKRAREGSSAQPQAMQSQSQPQLMPGGQDVVNPKARYGDRPGEIRPEAMNPPIKDEGGPTEVNSIHEAMPSDRKKRSEIPVYDEGSFTGDMTTHWADPGGKSEIMGGEVNIDTPRPRAMVMDEGGLASAGFGYGDRAGGPVEAAPATPHAMMMDCGGMYDEGGEPVDASKLPAVPSRPKPKPGEPLSPPMVSDPEEATFDGQRLTHGSKGDVGKPLQQGSKGDVVPPHKIKTFDEGGPHGPMELADAGPSDEHARVLDAGDSGNQAYMMQYPGGMMPKQGSMLMGTGVAAEDNISSLRAPDVQNAPGFGTQGGVDQGVPATPGKGGTDPIDRRIRPVEANAPDVNDGQHYPAVLMRGERVLTPAQNSEWMKDQHAFGANTNPTGGLTLNINMGGDTRDTDEPETKQMPVGGAMMPTQNSQANAPAYDDGGQPDDSMGVMPGEDVPEVRSVSHRIEDNKLKQHRDNLDAQMVDAFESNDILKAGMAALGHQQADNAERRRHKTRVYDNGGDAGAGIDIQPQGAQFKPEAAEGFGMQVSPSKVQGLKQPQELAPAPVRPQAAEQPAPAVDVMPKTEAGETPFGMRKSTGLAESAFGPERPTPAPGAGTMMPTQQHSQALSENYKESKRQLQAIIADPNSSRTDVDNARATLARIELAHPILKGVPRDILQAALGPNLMASVPGSAQNLAEREAQARADLQGEATLEGTRAETELKRVQAAAGGFRPVTGRVLTPQEQAMQAAEFIRSGQGTPEQNAAAQQVVDSFAQVQQLAAESTTLGKPDTKEQVTQKVLDLNAKPPYGSGQPGARTQDQEQYFQAHKGEAKGSLPVDPARRQEMLTDMAARRAAAPPTMQLPEPNIPAELSGDDAEKRYDDYVKQAEGAPLRAEELTAKQLANQKAQVGIGQQVLQLESSIGSFENYRDYFHRWLAAPENPAQRAKDIGIINDTIQQVEAGENATLNTGALTEIGTAMAGGAAGGPVGAGIGAGIGLALNYVGQAFAPALNGLSQRFKNGEMSPEAYATANAYLASRQSALVMALTSGGERGIRSPMLLKGSYAQLPLPTVTRENFDPAFNTFYKPKRAMADMTISAYGKTPDYSVGRAEDLTRPATRQTGGGGGTVNRGLLGKYGPKTPTTPTP